VNLNARLKLDGEINTGNKTKPMDRLSMDNVSGSDGCISVSEDIQPLDKKDCAANQATSDAK